MQQIVFVHPRIYDDLVKAGLQAGYAPTQQLPIRSYAEYVRAVPRPPKEDVS